MTPSPIPKYVLRYHGPLTHLTPTWDIMSLKLHIKMSHVVFFTDPQMCLEPVSLTPTELTDFTVHPHLSKSIPFQLLHIYIYRHKDIYFRYIWCVHFQQIFCSNFPAKTGDGLDTYKSCAPTMRGTTPETLTGTWCSKALPPDFF